MEAARDVEVLEGFKGLKPHKRLKPGKRQA